MIEVNRYGVDPHRDRFDHAPPGWRSRVPIDELSKTSLPGWFFNAWCDAIRDLGFKVSGQMPQITDGKGRTIYRMVFLSRHELPDRIWGDIARSPTSTCSTPDSQRASTSLT